MGIARPFSVRLEWPGFVGISTDARPKRQIYDPFLRPLGDVRADPARKNQPQLHTIVQERREILGSVMDNYVRLFML